MTRIEKTKINCSAFIVLCSTLKELQTENKFEIFIKKNMLHIVEKQNSENKEIEFITNLNFLDELFNALMAGDCAPLVLTGKAEEYLKNCSAACNYYRNQTNSRNEFDHFEVFHDIHFNSSKSQCIDDIVRQICGLFRIEKNLCLPFINCNKNFTKTIELQPKKAFNEIFRTVSMLGVDIASSSQISFTSGKLEMTESLDSLFAIKDLLSSKGINTSTIPEYNSFSIEQHTVANYTFNSTNGDLIKIEFSYDHIEVDIKKNC